MVYFNMKQPKRKANIVTTTGHLSFVFTESESSKGTHFIITEDLAVPYNQRQTQGFVFLLCF